MSEITIRDAVANDADALSKLVRAAMVTYKEKSGIKGDVLESLTESRLSVLERIKTQHCLCAELDGEIIGTITICKVSNPLKYNFSSKTFSLLSKYDSCSYISRFAVTASARKTGVGIKLMDAALETSEFKETGLVLLHTAVSNRPMKDFYFNRGFGLLDTEPSRGYERGLFYKIM